MRYPRLFSPIEIKPGFTLKNRILMPALMGGYTPDGVPTPQLQEYFFPLLASVFLILSAYHSTTLAAGKGHPRQLAFFSQGALFLCCLSLNSEQGLLYLGMLLWTAVQLYPCIRAKKEA